MEQPISFSISDLIQLLRDHSLTRGGLSVKVAPQRFACRIKECLWQGSDSSDLQSHVRQSHEETSCKSKDEPLQLVFSEIELGKLATQGSGVIEGNQFQVVKPVQFIFSADGGKWVGEGKERIYNTQTLSTAKEAQLLEQLQNAKKKHVEEMVKKDEVIKAQQETSNLARARIEKLERELADMETSFSSAQMICNEDQERQSLSTSPSCKFLERVNSRLEISTAALENQLQSVSEVIGKGILVWAEEHANDKHAIDTQEKQIAELEGKMKFISDYQEKQMAALRAKLNQNDNLIADAISMHKRFLIYAREGLSNSLTRSCPRSAEVVAIVNKGNDVAHRANVMAHVTLYQRGELSPDDIATFEKMYGIHPQKWPTSLTSPKAVKMWNMMGTVAATLARLKFGSSYSRLYQDFESLCEKMSSIRTSIEKEKGIEEDGVTAFDEHVEVISNLRKMKVIASTFTQQDKLQRSGSED